MLEGKKIIILGDRDGVPGGAIEACLAGRERGGRVLHDRVLCLNERRSNGPGEPEAGESPGGAARQGRTSWSCLAARTPRRAG